jgi:uncharacterized protein YcfJ
MEGEQRVVEHLLEVLVMVLPGVGSASGAVVGSVVGDAAGAGAGAVAGKVAGDLVAGYGMKKVSGLKRGRVVRQLVEFASHPAHDHSPVGGS